MSKIRVAFFGSPELAVPSLQALLADERYEVVLVVTQPDRPVGRGRKLQSTPIALLAEKHDLPVCTPERVRPGTDEGDALIARLQQDAVDVGVVVAYGHILRQELLDAPKHGFVNVHPSLLPRHRGATPIQAAILAGDENTGVSIMVLDAGMDTGPVLLQQERPLTGSETAETLHDALATEGATLLVEAIAPYVNGTLKPVEQDDAQATVCSLLRKEDGEIDWSEDPVQIERQVRAMTPWPGAYTTCEHTKIAIESVAVVDGAIQVLQVRPAGKKSMSYTAFHNGHSDCPLPPPQG